MMGWMNQEQRILRAKGHTLEALTLSIMGYSYIHLPFVIQQALKDPNSFLSKELAACQLYFAIREEVRKYEAQMVFMQIVFKELMEDMEFLIEAAAKKQHELQQMPVSSQKEQKEEVSKLLKERELLINQIKETMAALGALYKHREGLIERLKSTKENVDVVIIERSENVITYIDHANEAIDEEATEIIAQEEDPRKREQMNQTLHTIQSERKASKQRAEKVPEVLEKSGLIVMKKDQMLRQAVIAEFKFKEEGKNYGYIGVKKNTIDNVQKGLSELVKKEDEKITKAYDEVKKVEQEIQDIDVKIEEKSKEIVALETRLNLLAESSPAKGQVHKQVDKIDADTLSDKINHLLNDIRKFSDDNMDHLMEEEKSIDQLSKVEDELTLLLNNSNLPVSERFVAVSSLINGLSHQKDTISTNPVFTQLFQTLTDNLEQKVQHISYK